MLCYFKEKKSFSVICLLAMKLISNVLSRRYPPPVADGIKKKSFHLFLCFRYLSAVASCWFGSYPNLNSTHTLKPINIFWERTHIYTCRGNKPFFLYACLQYCHLTFVKGISSLNWFSIVYPTFVVWILTSYQ